MFLKSFELTRPVKGQYVTLMSLSIPDESVNSLGGWLWFCHIFVDGDVCVYFLEVMMMAL